MYKLFSIVFIHCLLSSVMFSQDISPDLQAYFIIEDIEIDGILDEPAWKHADSTEFFYQYFPSDSAVAQYPTTVRVLYDDHMLYASFKAFSENSAYVVSTLQRDFGGRTNDNVSLVFDTFKDGINAFFFGVTPYGVRREGLIFDGGNGFDNTWDSALGAAEAGCEL